MRDLILILSSALFVQISNHLYSLYKSKRSKKFYHYKDASYPSVFRLGDRVEVIDEKRWLFNHVGEILAITYNTNYNSYYYYIYGKINDDTFYEKITSPQIGKVK